MGKKFGALESKEEACVALEPRASKSHACMHVNTNALIRPGTWTREENEIL
jgi:hypothetical protein